MGLRLCLPQELQMRLAEEVPAGALPAHWGQRARSSTEVPPPPRSPDDPSRRAQGDLSIARMKCRHPGRCAGWPHTWQYHNVHKC